MLKISALVLLMALQLACGFHRCPDGKRCYNRQTCCMTTTFGSFACCGYRSAVCCADKIHCCPPRTHCDHTSDRCVRDDRPWESFPMLEKTEAEDTSALALTVAPPPGGEARDSPSQRQETETETEAVTGETAALATEDVKSTVVWCDRRYYCTNGHSCCHTRRGRWWCCSYSPSKCCVSGRHCCPVGYDCNRSSTRCLRHGLRYPFTPRLASASVPAMTVSEPGEDQADGQDDGFAVRQRFE